MNVTPIHGLKLLDVREVTARTKLSRAQIYRKMADGTFPRHRKLSAQRSVWAEHEVDGWIREFLEATKQAEHA